MTQAVSHHRHGSAIFVITESRNADIADRRLEFDKGMSSVVQITRAGFAAGTEISVVTHGALVAVSLDIGLNAIARVAKRTVTIDAMMASLTVV